MRGLKRCKRCKEIKELTNFSRKKYAKDGYQSWCKLCESKHRREKYKQSLKIRSRTKVRMLQVHQLSRQYLWQYKLEHPCIDCGETNPICLTFDHVRGKKRKQLSLLKGHSLKTIKKEIKKCEVRCFNCHAIRTAIQRKYWVPKGFKIYREKVIKDRAHD